MAYKGCLTVIIIYIGYDVLRIKPLCIFVWHKHPWLISAQYSLVRRKILRLYFSRHPYCPLSPHHTLNGASPVETQNLASPVLLIAINSCNNVLDNNRIYSLVRRKILRLYFSRHTYCPLSPHHTLNGASPVETQNLASPVLPIAIYSFNNSLTIIAYTPL